MRGASHIEEAAASSDVVLSVSKPDADLTNIPKVIALGKRIVIGTTGFTTAQTERLNSMLKTVPTVISTNFSVGANIIFQITHLVSRFNRLYDYSIIEEHHKMKADAPSGTARTMLQLLNRDSAFPVTITDRTAKPKRMDGEVEIVSLRGGGTPGIHQLILSGEHDMIRIEHIAFSRRAMAAGALLACKWIASQEQPGIYSMKDVLGLTQP
jgi:4-hydroxy-tetrahydrodipicolinate reductase